MVRFTAMSLVLTALAAVNKAAAFGVNPVSRSIGRSFTKLASSDNDFDGFSSKVREITLYWEFPPILGNTVIFKVRLKFI